MSRIGKMPIPVPESVAVAIADNQVTVKGPKGELSETIPAGIQVELEENVIHVKRDNDTRDLKAKHGLVRALLANMVLGTQEGYKRELEIVGVGYTAEKAGKENVLFKLGYTHSILFHPPEGVVVDIPSPTSIVITGISKQKVGQVAADIRAFKKPEPYKGKGIRFKGEHVIIKAGKTAKK